MRTSNGTSFLFDEEEAVRGGCEWFAIQVKSRYEERIASILMDKGYPALAATTKTAPKTRPSGYGESRALFPGYIFARFEVLRRLPVLVTPGVQSIVGYGKVPVPVAEHEIAAIQRVLESGQIVEPCPFLRVGDLVEVHAGPLKGMQGILLQQRSACRVVLSVSLIQRSIRVEVPESALTVIHSAPCEQSNDRPRVELNPATCVG